MLPVRVALLAQVYKLSAALDGVEQMWMKQNKQPCMARLIAPIMKQNPSAEQTKKT